MLVCEEISVLCVVRASGIKMSAGMTRDTRMTQRILMTHDTRMTQDVGMTHGTCMSHVAGGRCEEHDQAGAAK